MAKQDSFQKANVVYVEPNEIAEYIARRKSPYLNDKDISNNISWNQEDLQYSVDLKVIIPDRMDCGQTNLDLKENNFKVNTTISNTNESQIGRYVSFMGGEDIKNENYLTTSYTDISYQEINGNGISGKETLGIKDIEINFDAHFFPVVKINFTDVRGSALFGPTENVNSFERTVQLMEKNGDGSAKSYYNENKDKVSTSFFKALFHFPYPKFLLSVKGFYGDKVTFILAVSDFKTAFNSLNGNFDVTVTFIGYMYGLYTDIPMNLVIAAPYYNNRYWEEHRGEKSNGEKSGTNLPFRFIEDGQEGERICTFIEFIQKYDSLLNGDGIDDVETSKVLADFSELNSEKTYLMELQNLYNIFLRTIGSENTLVINGDTSTIFVYEKQDGITLNSAVFEKYFKQYEICENRITDFTENVGTEIFAKNAKEGIYTYTAATSNPILISTDKNEIVIGGGADMLADIILKDETLHTIYGDTKDKIKESILKKTGYSKYPYFVEIQNRKFINKLKARIVEVSNQIQNSKDSADKEIRKYITNKFGFTLSIENIYRMIFAHIDTFIDSFNKLLDNIYDDNQHQRRDPMALGLSRENSDLTAKQVYSTKTPPFFAYKLNGKIVFPGIEDAPNVIQQCKEVEYVNNMFNSIEQFGIDFNLAENRIEPSVTTYDSVFDPISLNDISLKDNIYSNIGSISSGINETGNLNTLVYFIYTRIIAALSIMPTDCFNKKSFLEKIIDLELNNVKKQKPELSDNELNTLSGYTYDKLVEFNNSKKTTIKDTTTKENKVVNKLIMNTPQAQESNIPSLLGTSSYLYLSNQSINPNKIISFTDINIDNFDDKNNENDVKFTEKNYISEIIDMGNKYKVDKIQDVIDLYNSCNLYENGKEIYIKDKSNQGISKVFIKNKDGMLFDYSDNLPSLRSFKEYDIKIGKNYTANIGISNYENYYIKNILRGSGNFKESIVTDKSGTYSSIINEQDNNYAKSLLFLAGMSNFYSKMDTYFSIIFNTENTNVTAIPKVILMYLGGLLYYSKSNKKNGLNNDDVHIKWNNKHSDEFNKYFESISSVTIGDKTFLVGSTLKEGVNSIIDSNRQYFKNDQIKGDYLSKLKSMDIAEYIEDMFISFAENYCNSILNELNNKENILDNDAEIAEWKKDSTASKIVTALYFDTSFILTRVNNIATLDTIQTLVTNVLFPYAKGKLISNVYSDEFKFKNTVDNIKTESARLAETKGDEIKMAMYYTLKTLHDKWLCTYTRDKFKLNSISTDLGSVKKRFFEGEINSDNTVKNTEFNSFLYVDSLMHDIGGDFLVNPDVVYELIKKYTVGVNNTIGVNSSVFEFMNEIAEKSKLLFISLPVYSNFYNLEAMKNIFTPNFQYWHEKNNYDRGYGNTYLLVYTGEVSNKLNNEDDGFQDDAYDILGSDILSQPVKIDGADENREQRNMIIPAFGVTYAKQNQMYFKNINVNMDRPKVTDYSISNLLQLSYGGAHGSDLHSIGIGQDIYSIYSNNSYTCTVEMLGCANIMPMMYFSLNSIPMFRGLYMIINVSHNISAGVMTTKFTGVRLSKNNIGRVELSFDYQSIFNRLKGINDKVIDKSKTKKISALDGTLSIVNGFGCCYPPGWDGFPVNLTDENKIAMETMITSVTINVHMTQTQDGTLTVNINKGIADSFKNAFVEIYNSKMPNGEKICIKTIGGYRWDNVQDVNGERVGKMSNHSYGIAFDINASNTDFSKDTNGYMDKNKYDKDKDHKNYKKDTPTQFRTWNHPAVTILNGHGFGWGIYSDRYDFMHFSADTDIRGGHLIGH